MRLQLGFFLKKKKLKEKIALTTLEAHELTKWKFTLNNPTDRMDTSIPLPFLEIPGIIFLFYFIFLKKIIN